MKILNLQAENIKRLKVVEIQPDGSVVVVGGKNAQGKTSVLDSISMALGGGKQIPDEPIRKGQKKAQVVLRTDEIQVTRKFTQKGSALEVKGADGVKMSSPQKVLDALVGTLTFDPLEFMRSDPGEQQETLRRLTGVDVKEIDRKRAQAYEKRTEINRRAKEASARLRAMSYDGDLPDDEIRLKDLLAKRNEAESVNSKNKAKRDRLDQLKKEAKQLMADIKKLEETLEKVKAEGRVLKDEVKELKDQDIADITKEIDSAEDHNKQIRENQRYKELKPKVDALENEASELTDQIKSLDEQKQDAIANAKFPIDGLGFDADTVTFNDLPLSQASAAEQLRISVAIGLALNPKLRVLLIRDGSLLDEDNLRMIAEMAQDADAQIWIERVGDGDECAVVLEDGEVKS